MQPVATTINFLAGKQSEYRKKMRRLLLIQLGSFTILGLYIIGLAAVFGYYFYLNRANKKLEIQASQLSGQVQEYGPVEAKYVFIKTKVSALTPVLASQRKHQEIVEALLALLPEGISVKGFTVSEEGEINFSAEARTFKALEQFLNNLRKKKLTPQIEVKYAQVGSVRLKENGGYNMSVNLDLAAIK